jgi:hypothetical protein
MEEGTKTKKTVFVGGFDDDVDEALIFQAFSIFGTSGDFPFKASLNHDLGEILQVDLPTVVAHQGAGMRIPTPGQCNALII